MIIKIDYVKTCFLMWYFYIIVLKTMLLQNAVYENLSLFAKMMNLRNNDETEDCLF